jgi:O-antigen ligase/tetratricopeptide (TPR) repeat protein
VGVLFTFYQGYHTIDPDQLIGNLSGNTGHKNIMAASLVIKMPFVLYILHSFGRGRKIAGILVLLMATLAVFIINARASFLSLGLQLLIYTGYCISGNFSKTKFPQLTYRVLVVLIPVLVSLFISQLILKNAVENQDKKGIIGTVTERLGTINFTAEGSSSRTIIWTSAWDYIKKHPLRGAGYGNWKLESIPYEKTYLNEMRVGMHAHNDFLETTAETGLPGGLLFILIFILAFVFLLKTLTGDQSAKIKSVALFSMMALSAYFVDTVFNFPMQRPVMQVYFVIILAIGVSTYLLSKANKDITINSWRKLHYYFILFLLCLLIPSVYLVHSTYTSLFAQRVLYKELATNTLSAGWDKVDAMLPSIPNINYDCIPIDAIKSLYLSNEKRYPEALNLLNKSIPVNPYLSFNEFEKAKIFLATNQIDSAFFYAVRAFYLKPRARTNWQLLNITCKAMGDTQTAVRAFREYRRYRNEAWAWNEFLNTIENMPLSHASKLTFADSAIRLFPEDPLLQQKNKALVQGATKPITADAKPNDAESYYQKAMSAFQSKKFDEAIRNFTKSYGLDPENYPAYENTGLCYFSMDNFKKALIYFDKVLLKFNPPDGKSAFFKGLCLVHLNNTAEACIFLKLAESKNYPEAKAQIAAYCK